MSAPKTRGTKHHCFLAHLKLLVVLKLGLVEAHVRQHRRGHAGEHAARVVVQEGLDARRARGMALVQPAHVVHVAVESDPLLGGTLPDVLDGVDRALPAEQHGDEPEDAHEERAGQEDAEADGHLLAPRLLCLLVVLLDARVGEAARDAAAEVVPPHGALIRVRLLDGHRAGLLRGLVAAVGARLTRHGAAPAHGVGHLVLLRVLGAAVGRHARRRRRHAAAGGPPGAPRAAAVVAPLLLAHGRLLLVVVAALLVAAVGLLVAVAVLRGPCGPALAAAAHAAAVAGWLVEVLRARRVLPAVGVVPAVLVRHALGVVAAAAAGPAARPAAALAALVRFPRAAVSRAAPLVVVVVALARELVHHAHQPLRVGRPLVLLDAPVAARRALRQSRRDAVPAGDRAGPLGRRRRRGPRAARRADRVVGRVHRLGLRRVVRRQARRQRRHGAIAVMMRTRHGTNLSSWTNVE